MSILPQIYQPSDAEISAVTASAKCRHPELVSRIGKAAQILSDGGLQLDSVAWDSRALVRWRIASQSHAGAYIVVGLHCPCQDKAAPVVDGIHFCKHSSAIAMYLKILRNRVQVDIRNFDVELGILDNGEFHGYAKRAGYMQLFKDGSTYRFSDTTSAVYYSLWLANRERVNIALPNAVVALAA